MTLNRISRASRRVRQELKRLLIKCEHWLLGALSRAAAADQCSRPGKSTMPQSGLRTRNRTILRICPGASYASWSLWGIDLLASGSVSTHPGQTPRSRAKMMAGDVRRAVATHRRTTGDPAPTELVLCSLGRSGVSEMMLCEFAEFGKISYSEASFFWTTPL